MSFGDELRQKLVGILHSSKGRVHLNESGPRDRMKKKKFKGSESYYLC